MQVAKWYPPAVAVVPAPESATRGQAAGYARRRCPTPPTLCVGGPQVERKREAVRQFKAGRSPAAGRGDAPAAGQAAAADGAVAGAGAAGDGAGVGGGSHTGTAT